ncbi:hypothetical protein KKB06_02385 [Patescibacteria group bacterium]|nr:hypothetical protein [Patescibacteria group bacterium]
MKRFFQKKKRVNEYRPNRIKRSQVKILFTSRKVLKELCEKERGVAPFIEYRPTRIKRSQVKILFTPVEYVIAGREIAEEE